MLLMLYLLQRAQPDFPSRVTPCLAGSTSQACQPGDNGFCQCSKLQGWQQTPAASLLSSTEQKEICHASGAELFPWFHFQMLCWEASGTFFSCILYVLTVKYSERRVPKVKDGVNVCSSSTQWYHSVLLSLFFLCKFAEFHSECYEIAGEIRNFS